MRVIANQLRAHFHRAAPDPGWSVLQASGHSAAKTLAGALRGLGPPLPAELKAIEAVRRQLGKNRAPLADQAQATDAPFNSAMTIGQAVLASMPAPTCRLLHALVKGFQAKSVLELGTNVGISSAYIARATGGHVLSLEGSPCRARVAREVHGQLGIGNCGIRVGLFNQTLAGALQELGWLDFAFIDGHHKTRPTLRYLEQVLPFARPGAVFLFDDIRWSEGMEVAWEAIRQDARFSFTADLDSIGLCVLRTGDEPTAHIPRMTRGPQGRGWR